MSAAKRSIEAELDGLSGDDLADAVFDMGIGRPGTTVQKFKVMSEPLRQAIETLLAEKDKLDQHGVNYNMRHLLCAIDDLREVYHRKA